MTKAKNKNCENQLGLTNRQRALVRQKGKRARQRSHTSTVCLSEAEFKFSVVAPCYQPYWQVQSGSSSPPLSSRSSFASRRLTASQGLFWGLANPIRSLLHETESPQTPASAGGSSHGIAGMLPVIGCDRKSEPSRLHRASARLQVSRVDVQEQGRLNLRFPCYDLCPRNATSIYWPWNPNLSGGISCLSTCSINCVWRISARTFSF